MISMFQFRLFCVTIWLFMLVSLKIVISELLRYRLPDASSSFVTPAMFPTVSPKLVK